MDFGEVNGKPATLEAELKKRVLMPTSAMCVAAGKVSKNAEGGCSAFMSAVGMGGVGKTCALVGLTGFAEVRAQFVDGIYLCVGG